MSVKQILTRCREVALYVVVVNRGTGTLELFEHLGERARQLPLRTNPPHPALTGSLAGVVEFVGEEPVTKVRVVVVRVKRGIVQIGVFEVASSDGTSRLGSCSCSRT